MKKEIVEFLKTDDTKTLMMRGEHTVGEVIDAAIKSEEIEEEDRQQWEKHDRFDVGYFKAVPRDGYSTYYYPSNKDVKGSFLATTLTNYW
ncbi:hypothetical protein L9H26_04035 [Morganella psychrotolerans]|uniref:Uncharacterized protein n=1 Tax=Morganella psychrotolerans TaxID=368603 RepID=A0A5M9R925_9GAMM|nr:hypothetical protein [Morganella psychrotolerans]KAA8717454.1 hypothetical protein F4V73_06315 [Morganella psychrotolerans]OBU08274.1 hypothetical protein AYY16_02710 [Morganella psychrotolerans]